jgi:predicted transposase/invertase (TIGR01784 family)
MPIHKARDNSFKLILGDHHLFVSFLRDFIHIDALKDVQPEDIEDISERFLPLFQDNRDSDTVKRINLKGDTPLFVIAVIEHESRVNYRAPFKMLQYITLVLDKYEKEVTRKHPDLISGRDFRYPPVLPIIFYDGASPWTAERNFAFRTAMRDAFAAYIPSFEYELVDLNTYSREDIFRFNDALSLVLLIDKIGTREGLSLLSKLPEGYVEQLALNIPEGMTKLLSDVITVLLDRLAVPKEEIAAVTGHFEKKEYQTMFDALVESVLEDKRLAREEGRNEGRREGWKEGRQEEALRAARRMKALGMNFTQIQDVLDLSPEDITKL